jgi:hypothetical protein
MVLPMCTAKAFKSFSGRKLRQDLIPDLNPVKHIKKTLKNDFDFAGVQDMDEAQRKALAAQQASIDKVNAQTREDASAGTYLAGPGYVKGGAGDLSASGQRRRRSSLLTESTTTNSLLS